VEWNDASFTSSLKLLYAETPETDRLLKDVAIKAAASHVKELVNQAECVDLCRKNGEIAFDMLKAPLDPQSSLRPCIYAAADTTTSVNLDTNLF